VAGVGGRTAGPDGGESIAAILRRLLTEPAKAEFQDVDDGRILSNAEVLARKLMDRALRGDEKVQGIVIDRVEGKAGRAADPKTGDDGLLADLAALDVSEINDL
jgi:hypothetical protein